MVRAPCCETMGLKKGPWTPEEDHILIAFIQNYGHGNWRALPKQAGLLRCGKSCRLRWLNYLRPGIKRGNFSKEEEETMLKLHQILENRWSAIAARLPGRTDNEIKNYWLGHLKKRLKQKSSDQKLLRKDINNATRISKPAENLITTHQRIQINPEDTPIFLPESRLEFACCIGNDGSADASVNIPGVEQTYDTRDVSPKETMNYDGSNVAEFWYNILMEAAGNSNRNAKEFRIINLVIVSCLFDS